jgi:hypothetical protein
MSINVCNDRSMASITSLPSGVSGSSLVLLETQTASSSSTISFTSNIDSTYKEYIFKFIDIHPSAEYAHFSFQADTGTNTNYNQTITSTAWTSTSNEGGTEAIINYQTASDQGQGTGFQYLTDQLEADNDSCAAGTLHIFDPSNTTFVKHFIARTQFHQADPSSREYYVSGYFNTTTALTRFQFKMHSGNIDAGTIKLYGVS